MKKINNYNTVNTKNGKAIVADTQTELENIAKQINGDVVLLTRRDGENSYSDLGTVVLPYGFGITDFTADDMKYGTEAETYVIHDLIDYLLAIKNENDCMREILNSYSLTVKDDEFIKKDADIIKEVATLKDGDCMFLRVINGQQFFDTFRKEQTRWHDADVSEYRLAVVTL